MYTRYGVTSFNSCPNPERETISLLRWHRIRLDLTRSFSHLRQGHAFPCCLPTSNFTSPKRINHPWLPKCSPPPPPRYIKPILHDMSDNRTYLCTRSSWIFVLAVLNVTWTTVAVIRLLTNRTEAALCDFSKESIVLSRHPLLCSPTNAAAFSWKSGNFLLHQNLTVYPRHYFNNRVHKLPFIGVGLTKHKSLISLQIHLFPELRSTWGFFRSEKTWDESEHVQKRLRTGSGC